MRREDIAVVRTHVVDPGLHGAVILGPRGVGKSTLAGKVARSLEETCHVIRLFGTGDSIEVPYGIFSLQLARLNARQSENPSSILGALTEQMFQDAHGLPIVLVLDELPGIDMLSMGVLTHLVLGGKAKLLVAARSAADCPEDLAWMIKDGLLAQKRLAPFSRIEVRSILTNALDGPVAESVVATLYSASAGNPLVLHALAHEYLSSGVLRAIDGIWVQVGHLDRFADDALVELVESRLARESAQVRTTLEKFSLLKNVPIAMAIQVMGADAVGALEERGFLVVDAGRGKTVSFAEPYIGEALRNRLSAAQKAAYFQELSNHLALDVAKLSQQELLILASWIHEAGLAMVPEVALAAAQEALRLFDPQLALACLGHIPAKHRLAVRAAQESSRAHYLMADYSRSAEILSVLSPSVLDGLTAQEYASWAMNLTSALAWLPGTKSRIDRILAQAMERIEQAPQEERLEAEKIHNLARFEVHVNRGEFFEVLQELQIASKDRHDRAYRLNCACLLTMALAATGRELDAIELSQQIDEEAAHFDVVLRMHGWQLYGGVLALIWSGQWRSCEQTLRNAIDFSNNSLHYRGGAIELALGVAYASAGRDMQAAEILLVSAAQLEVRDIYTSLEVVYSVMACVFARLDNKDQALRYLKLAQDSGSHSVWVNRTLSDHFQTLAAHALGDSAAMDLLVAAAGRDLRSGRTTPAAHHLLTAVASGVTGLYDQLERVAQNCQGDLAGISIKLAQAARARGNDGARLALEAARQAETLELGEIERHANALALSLAVATGEKQLQRTARNRLRILDLETAQEQEQGPGVDPLTPRELQVARQAISGMSNRDIASKIGVSVRTVEGHLYQVFAKLGITSRVELDKWVHL